MKTINIILLGYGRVGKAFARLIQEKQNFCLDRYNLLVHIAVVLRRNGGLFLYPDKEGMGSLSDLVSRENLEELPYWRVGMDFGEVLECQDLDVLVDCTPSNIKDGEPAIGYVHQALARGWHVVTANKGPLVVDFDGVRKRAAKNHVSLGMSGATAAALPTLDIALHSLAGTDIHRIEGILNGTTNYMLTRMRAGMEFSDALTEAKQKGIAEPDPSQDVEGWDTAAKILIITNAIFGTGYALKDIQVEGITNIPTELQEKARTTGNVLKLLGRCVQNGKMHKLETRLSVIEPSHPLYGVDGAQKGITFFTDTMDSVTVTGGKSDPRGAAAALLKDIINIYRDYSDIYLYFSNRPVFWLNSRMNESHSVKDLYFSFQ
jgi:homoserine dehydrogenase